MLKPAEPDPTDSGGAGERPIGELAQQIVADGKAYAEAELNVAKAIVQEKVEGLKLPVGLGFGALLFLQASVVILGLTVYATLVSRLGPLLAGLIATLLFLGIAGGLAWLAARKLRDLL